MNKEQINLLKKMNLPTNFSNLTDEEWFKIDEVMSHELQVHGVNEAGDGLNEYGELCQSVIESLPDD